jgi:hypothetical protein
MIRPARYLYDSGGDGAGAIGPTRLSTDSIEMELPFPLEIDVLL